jgi:hypothetical protein
MPSNSESNAMSDRTIGYSGSLASSSESADRSTTAHGGHEPSLSGGKSGDSMPSVSSTASDLFRKYTKSGNRRCQALVGQKGKQCTRQSKAFVTQANGTVVDVCQQHADMVTAGLQTMYFIRPDGVVTLLQQGTKDVD